MNAESKFVASVMDARLKKVKRERNKFKDERDGLIKDIGELRKYKHMYQALVEHIRVKAEANPSEWRYISLVHFVDDLEEEE